MKDKRLLIIFLTIFIDLLGFGLIIPLLSPYAKELGAPEWAVGMVVAMYPLVNFFCTPVLGSLSDRIGRRPIILGAIAVNFFANLLFAHANTITLLVFARILGGFGSSNISAAQAYISDITLPENRARAMGMIGAAFGLGFVLGPAIASPISDRYPDSDIYILGLMSAALCLLNLVWAYFALPESLENKNLSAKIKFIPISDFLDAFRRPVIKEILTFNFVYITAFMFLQVTLSLLWLDHYGMTKAETAKGFMTIGILTAIVQAGLIGKLVKKFGERKLLYNGTFIMAVGILMPPFAFKEPTWLFLVCNFVSIALICFANGMMTPTSNSLLTQHVGAHEQGKIQGLAQSFSSLARVVGATLSGVLYYFHYALPYVCAAALMLLCSWLVRLAILQMRTKPV